MTRQTLTANYLNTISWFNNTIVDWDSAGTQYFLDGSTKQLRKYHLGLPSSAAITTPDGMYNFIYSRLGTKGLLLKNGELLREIDRSYYCADVYEYPAAFATVKNKTYLIHCPISYKQLDFEDVETGQLITNIPGREPIDFFHSRLEISPDGKYLIDRGWAWHPLDWLEVYNIQDCLDNPKLLDNSTLSPDIGTEICTASFINSSKILIGSSNEVINNERADEMPIKSLAIWDLETNRISNPTKVNGTFGNLFAINDDYAWDMFDYPKIINIHTGEIVDKDETIDSGKRNSAIAYSLNEYPQIIFNRDTKQIALSGKDKIEVLTPTL